MPSDVGGHWQHISVKWRADEQARLIANTKRRASHPKRWQPDEGRESPREEFMYWRRCMYRYEFAGCMRFNHGKAPALVGLQHLYDPFSPRQAYRSGR